jgi:hypothetical protein
MLALHLVNSVSTQVALHVLESVMVELQALGAFVVP